VFLCSQKTFIRIFVDLCPTGRTKVCILIFPPHPVQNIIRREEKWMARLPSTSRRTQPSLAPCARSVLCPYLQQLVLFAATRFICSNSSYLQQLVLFAATRLICSNSFYLQQLVFYLQQPVLFAACPLWATVENHND